MSWLQNELFIGAALLCTAAIMATRIFWVTRPIATTAATRSATPTGSRLLSRTGALAPHASRFKTPVSLVSTALIESAGSDTREIARRTGLARDAVVMMVAHAEHAERTRLRAPRLRALVN
jgi:hypothetical protein